MGGAYVSVASTLFVGLGFERGALIVYLFCVLSVSPPSGKRGSDNSAAVNEV